MLWEIMCSNFECKLHNAIAIKEVPNHILQCSFYFSIFFLQYIDGCIWSIINDCTTSFTLIFCWKMAVIDKFVLCVFLQNIGIYSIDAYMNTTINNQEDYRSTHFISFVFYYRCNGHYRLYTFAFFQLF